MNPVPLDRLPDWPDWLVEVMQKHGIVTCEQALDLVERLLAHAEPERRGDLEQLHSRLDAVVPDAYREALAEAAAASAEWIATHRLGVLEPPDLSAPTEPFPEDGAATDPFENDRREDDEVN